MANEFSIIKQFFQRPSNDKNIIINSGDDAAVLQIPAGYQLVVTMDTMVLGTHFTDQTPVFDVGYKAVTSTISDLAAMGAEPKWLTGSITMPDNDPHWLQQFSEGLFAAIDEYKLSLIGGDLTRGPLNITLQAEGIIPNGKAVTRAGAQVGDLIYVTNTLGDAGYGLQLVNGNQALNRPKAQIAAGLAMRDVAHSCIDVSDGLLQDLQHVLTASHVGAKIYLDQIPLSAELQKLNTPQVWDLALSAGEDYQLLMTVPTKKQHEFEKQMPVKVTCIGEIVAEQKLQLLDAQGKSYPINHLGYQHF